MAQAAPERLEVGEALEHMAVEACRGAYPADEQLNARCKREYFDDRSHNHEYLMEEGDRGDRECLVAGGVLRSKMPRCIEAMTALMAADRDHDTGAFFRALGEVVESCSSTQLCLGS